MMKTVSLFLFIVLFMMLVTAGCTSQQPAAAQSSAGDTLYARAESSFAQDNFHEAADLYGQAYTTY